MKRLWLFLVVASSLFACAKNEPMKIGFYHWKTHFDLTPRELSTLDSIDAQILYIRIFDVDWDYNKKQAIPKGTQTNPHPTFPKGIAATPTIYITNRALLLTKNIDTLAQKIIDYSNLLLPKWPLHPTKIQLDADWTPSTKNKYFQLIRYVKANSSFEKISTTIRLHQYKYPNKTGVPPSDEGTLMCYNTGTITDWKTENSIATSQEIAKYLNSAKTYPLRLGVALPVFSWTIIFRDSSFFKIVSDPDLSWQQDAKHFKKIAPNRYQVTQNTYLKGHYLYEGDLLRYETTTINELESIARLLAQKQKFYELLFYQLDENQLKRYSISDLEKIKSLF